MVNPNLARSPVEVPQRPMPWVLSFALTPKIGLMPKLRLISMAIVTSETCSTTIIGRCPKRLANRAVSIYSRSL